MEVAIRVRPLLSRESDLTNLWTCHNNSISSTKDGKTPAFSYNFDHVYGPGTDTTTVYEELAQKIVLQSMQGYHGTIFTYGQSGSGKTYTMDGLTQLALDTMYNYINTSHGREFILRVSYIELYNEHLFDLLAQKDGANLIVREDLEKNVYIEGLIEEVVQCKEDALKHINFGNEKRRFAETKQNDFSSRAHCILRIIIESREGVDDESSSVLLSHLNLVDLAGSEKAAENSSERLREGCHINKSLLALSLVVSKLSEDNNAHINYRDSKLTRILQNALGGNSRTAILCTISPISLEETLSTLRFANNARYVKNKPQQNMILSVAAQLKIALREIEALKKKLQKSSQYNCGEPGSREKSTLELSVIPDASLLDLPLLPAVPAVATAESRRKSMFVKDAKSRRKSFFVTSRSTRRRGRDFGNDFQLNDSGWGDPDMLLPQSQTEGLQEDVNDDDSKQANVEGREDDQMLDDELENPKQLNEDQVLVLEESQNDVERKKEKEGEGLMEEMTRMRQEVMERNNLLAEKDNMIQTLDQNVKSLQESLKKKTQSMATQTEEEINSLMEEINRYQQELDEKNHDLTGKMYTIQMLEEKLGTHKRHLEDQAFVLQELKNDSEREKGKEGEGLIEEMTRMRQEVMEKNNLLAEKDNMIQTLDQNVKSLQESLKKNTQSMATQREEEMKSLMEELTRMREEMMERNNLLAEKDNMIQTLDQTVTSLQEKIQETLKTQSMATQREEEMKSLMEEINRYQQELDEKNHDLTGKTYTIQMLEERIETQQQQEELQNDAESKKEKEGEGLIEEMTRVRQEMMERNNLLAEKDNMIQTLDQTVKTLQAKIQETWNDNMSVATQREEEMKNLMEEINRYQQELDEKEHDLTGKTHTIQMLEERLETQQQPEEQQTFVLHDPQNDAERKKEKEGEGLIEEMTRVRQEMMERNNLLAEKDNMIQTLDQTVKTLQAKIQETWNDNMSVATQREEEMKNLMEEINRYQQELDEKEHDLTGKTHTIQMLEERLETQQRPQEQQTFVLHDPQNDAERKTEKETEDLMAEMTRMRQEMMERNIQLAEKDNMIQTLDQTVKTLQVRIQETLDNNTNVATQTEEKVKSLMGDISRYQQDLDDKDNELTGKQYALQMMEERLKTQQRLQEEQAVVLQEFKNDAERKKEKEGEGLMEEMTCMSQEMVERNNLLAEKDNRVQMMEEMVEKLKQLHNEKEHLLLESQREVETQTLARQEELHELNTRLDQLMKVLEDKDRELDESRGTTQIMEETIKDLQVKCIEGEDKMRETMRENRVMEDNLTKVKQLYEEKEHLLLESRNEVQVMAEQLTKLKQEKEDLLVELHSEFQSQTDGRQEELCALNERLTHLTRGLEEKDRQLDGRQHIIQTMEQTIKDLEAKIGDQETKLQETKKLEETIRELEAICGEGNAKMGDILNENKLMEDNLTKLKKLHEAKEHLLMESQKEVQAMRENLAKLNQLQEEKEYLLVESQSEVQMKEEELTQLKELYKEKEHLLVESRHEVQTLEEKINSLPSGREVKGSTQSTGTSTEDLSSNRDVPDTQELEKEEGDDLNRLRSELEDRDGVLKHKEQQIKTLKDFIQKGREKMSDKTKENQSLTSTVESLQKEKKKMEQDCKRVEKSREEDREYYESMIQQYKLKIRKTQHLDSSYLDSEAEPISVQGKNGGESVVGDEEKRELLGRLDALTVELEAKNAAMKKREEQIKTLKQVFQKNCEAVVTKNKEIKTLEDKINSLQAACDAREATQRHSTGTITEYPPDERDVPASRNVEMEEGDREVLDSQEVEKEGAGGGLNRLRTELQHKDQQLKTLKDFIQKGQEMMSDKTKENQSLTSTVESLTRDKKKMEKDCQRLEKTLEEDREYYEMMIQRYKLKIRKAQNLNSSYLESEMEAKPLQSRVPNTSHHPHTSRTQEDKENVGDLATAPEKELADKLQHYENIIKDLQAQIDDQKDTSTTPSSLSRPQPFPNLSGAGVVDRCIMLNKDRYIKKLEHKLKKAEAEIQLMKGN